MPYPDGELFKCSFKKNCVAAVAEWSGLLTRGQLCQGTGLKHFAIEDPPCRRAVARSISQGSKSFHCRAIRLLTFAERSFPTLTDGAKYSLSSRGKNRLQISTLRSRVELTDSNCSRREVKKPTASGLALVHSQCSRPVRVAT
ncbi:hypothetical protein TNCV_1882431 [Trichonephila clavipes]|nr:hypothetical protein TNCV_1882431 [Trichonephila clavipes]